MRNFLTLIFSPTYKPISGFFFQFLILYFPFLTKLVIRFNTKKMSANNKLASYCFTVGGSEPD